MSYAYTREAIAKIKEISILIASKSCLISLCSFGGRNAEHEIYSLNKFVSTQHHFVNYRHYVVQQISRTYSSCITITLYLLNNNSPSPPLLILWPLTELSTLLITSGLIICFHLI